MTTATEPQAANDTSATTPLLGEAKVEGGVGPLVVTASTGAPAAPNSPTKSASSPSKQAQEQRPLSQTVTNEYRFVHLRIPPRDGKLRFLLPILLLVFQLIFIVLFALFANYSNDVETSSKLNKYPSTNNLI